MEMVRRIAFICAVHGCAVRVKHISGTSNPIADALSNRHGLLSPATPYSFSHSVSHPSYSNECLTTTLCSFEEDALAVNMQAAYTSGERVYQQLCERYGLAFVPDSEETLMYFRAHITKEHTFATVCSDLAAVHSFHIRTGHINSLINLYPTLGFFLRIKRSKGIHLRPQRLPVTVRILAAILCTLPQVVHNEHDL